MKHAILGLSARERAIIDSALAQGNTIIRSSQLQENGQNRESANLTLSRMHKKGWLQRLKAGVYRIVPLGSGTVDPVPEDIWNVAMEIFQPCYLGGWTAAEHWDLTEQIFNTIMVFSTIKQKRTYQKIAGLSFRIKLVHENQLFGTTRIWSQSKPVQIADIHRTVIDILDEPRIGGGGRAMVDIVNAYGGHAQADPEMLFLYATQLDHGVVFKRLGFLAEHIFKSQEVFLGRIEAKCKKGIVLLDPQGPVKGSIITRWGLRLNIPFEDMQ